MTSSVSGPTAPVLIPLGQPLGKIHAGDGEPLFQVRLGNDIHQLEMATAVVWRQLHTARPGTSRGLDRALLAQFDLSSLGVPDASPELDLLLDLGLAVEIAMTDATSRTQFAESFRLLPLHTIIGNSETDEESYMLAAGSEPTVSVDYPLAIALAFGPRDLDLDGTCFVASGGLGAVPETSHLGDPAALVQHVLEGIHPVLSVGGAYFDLAIAPYSEHEARGKRLDPASVELPEDEHTLRGLFPVGYLAGARYTWLGLESVNIRLGMLELELGTEEAWTAWTAAHGIPNGNGINDDFDAIIDSAKGFGAPAPVFDLDDQLSRGLIARPEGGERLIEFAATHRLEPLLAGLGNTLSDPEEFWLGVDSEHLVTALDRKQYETWRDAPLSRSLLDAAHAAGSAASAADLREFLRTVQILCMRRAAFIDLVRTS